MRRTLLALALAPVAFTQTSSSSDRNVTDQFIDFVGPIPASSTPHAERLSEFVLATVGPVPLLGEAAGAGINHWMNTPEEWGQGWGAYGKRYGSNLAYNAIRQTIGESLKMVPRTPLPAGQTHWMDVHAAPAAAN